jgi:hypothetical protein
MPGREENEAVLRPSAARTLRWIMHSFARVRDEGQGMKKKDSTEVMRVRQSVGQNKALLVICALLAIVGMIGWLKSL